MDRKVLVKRISGRFLIDTLIRVKTRNNAEHIAVLDNKVIESNKIASTVTYFWDLEFTNNDLTLDNDILDAIQSINDVEVERK